MEVKENIHVVSRRKINTFADPVKFVHTGRNLARLEAKKISVTLRKYSDDFLVAQCVSINTSVSNRSVRRQGSEPVPLSFLPVHISDSCEFIHPRTNDANIDRIDIRDTRCVYDHT